MAMSNQSFSTLTRDEILALSNKLKMQFYFQIQTRHKNLENVAEDLMELLTPNNETNVLALIGATGVGKTTLLKRLIRNLIEHYSFDEEQDRSSIPFIFISAPANGAKKVSWASIYERALVQGGEIMINKKHVVKEEDGFVTAFPKRSKTIDTLRDSLEEMLRHRKVKVLAIDEAYHLLRFGDYGAIMDTLKSLADSTGVKLVLIGSYDLFDLATDYGQVARRAEIVHFKRYKIDSKEDLTEFTAIVNKLQDRWPLEDVPNFVCISKELMEASLGCIGLLKALLLQALSLQIKNKGKWNPRILSKSAKSIKLLDKIRQEISDGEDKVEGATYGETIFSGAFFDNVVAKMSAR